MIIVFWFKTCYPLKEGGLGLRSLVTLNNAARLKLCLDLITSKHKWASILRHKTCVKSTIINYHISFSLWCGIKSKVSIIMNNYAWLAGKGMKLTFGHMIGVVLCYISFLVLILTTFLIFIRKFRIHC